MRRMTHPALPPEVTILNYEGDFVLEGSLTFDLYLEIKGALPESIKSRVIGWKASFGKELTTIH